MPWDEEMLDEEFFLAPQEHEVELDGIYFLVATLSDGHSKPIGRALGTDAEGVLYVGRSGAKQGRRLFDRLKEFWVTANGLRRKDSHSAGTRYKNCLLWEMKYPLERIKVVWRTMPHATPKKLIAAESREIRKYFNKYGEVPPLNASLPGANY